MRVEGSDPILLARARLDVATSRLGIGEEGGGEEEYEEASAHL